MLLRPIIVGVNSTIVVGVNSTIDDWRTSWLSALRQTRQARVGQQKVEDSGHSPKDSRGNDEPERLSIGCDERTLQILKHSHGTSVHLDQN